MKNRRKEGNLPSQWAGNKKRKDFKKRGKNQNKNPRIEIGTIKITQKPLGFVVVDGEKDDIIVFEENLNCALNNDEVEVEITGRDRDRKKGKIIRIIKRYKTKFVGTIEGTNFMPDDFKFYKKVDIFSLPGDINNGTKVLVEIEWNNPNLNPKGKIISVIGQKGEHETEMQSILLDKGIVYDFPADVEAEAEKVSRTPLDTSGRRDFRSALTFTIDPADAKDFDDALSYEEIGGGKIRMGVHIADVSHFVRPGGALDCEARKRAFSVYLVDRTIPMLPEVLSNDLCSLRPNEDRFAFSAVFDIEINTGKILDRWFGKTVINSNHRFSYEEAQEILESRIMNYESSVGRPAPSLAPRRGSGSEADRGEVFVEALFQLDRLAKIYREANRQNGAIEFETEEVKFELDDTGKPVRVYKKERLDTMKMIEEWMLLANREVAKFISDKIDKKGGTSIFRVHDLPNMERLEELAIFVRALGRDLPIKGGSINPKDLNMLLSDIGGHASESLVKTAAVRSMAKAVYSTKNIGHFGLAFEYYTHFTSPIRRYPDLMVHRILESYLKNQAIPKNELAKFQKIADESSEKEVVVQEAERDSIKYKQVEYMQNKIGQIFDCVVSGVTEWGMYVENPETKAEGLVRLRDMGDDYYKLDQKNYCIVGERTHRKFSLGDSVRVRLTAADLDRKTLDFKLV